MFSRALINHKSVCVLGVRLRRLFANFRHAGKPRAAFQFLPELRQLRYRSCGEHLDTAIEKVFYIAAEAQILGYALNEKTIAHALYDSGNVVTLCLFRFAHKLLNCSREASTPAARQPVCGVPCPSQPSYRSAWKRIALNSVGVRGGFPGL